MPSSTSTFTPLDKDFIPSLLISSLVNKVREGKDAFGYNARDDKYEDMLKAGIIDPTKVSRVALENAASIASMFLTDGCALLAEKKSEQPAVPAMPGGGMGGMM